jgi:hypothetical protein
VNNVRGMQYETSQLPHFLDSWLTDGDGTVSPMHRSITRYPPERNRVLISVRGRIDARDRSATCRMTLIDKCNEPMGNRGGDLPGCSIMAPSSEVRAMF